MQIETVSNLASGCGKLDQLEYKKIHDIMGLRVYWEMYVCKKYGVKMSSEKWYEKYPEKARKKSVWRVRDLVGQGC